MLEILQDCVIDTVKIIPFLFLTYLLMEYIEHRTSEKTKGVIRRAGKMGPLLGGVLGAIPQCGFSAAAAGFYSGRVITVGTLLAVFLSTSDEMLPILLSSQVPLTTILHIVGLKALIGILAGILADFFLRKFNQRKIGDSIHDLCDHDQCHCEESIVKSAAKHTLNITLFIFLVSLALNLVIALIGEDNLGNVILNQPVVGEILAGIIGLIPNCAASVVITTLYMEGAMSAGAMMSGLLVGAGVGLLVLFRTNSNLKENMKITGLLYVSGVAGGLALELLQVTL
ncbi:MAG: putative manganese transporter [Lachnospiraceae bacterium]|nr:putative manganese transporter [Lachnospiraceae bacterium]